MPPHKFEHIANMSGTSVDREFPLSFLNWADILTVERAIVVLVKLGGNRDDGRESRGDAQSRFGP